MKNTTENILKNLMEFLNANIKEMSITQFSSLLQAYSMFLTHNHEKYGFPDSRKKFRQLDDHLSTVETAECKSIFLSIQKYLRSKIDLIIDGVNKKRDISIFENVEGKQNIILDGKNKHVLRVFIPHEIKETTILRLEYEKKHADLALIDLLLDYDLTPDRLKNCPYCGDYFFQPTNQPRLYCTSTHGHLYRKKDKSKKIKKSKKK